MVEVPVTTTVLLAAGDHGGISCMRAGEKKRGPGSACSRGLFYLNVESESDPTEGPHE